MTFKLSPELGKNFCYAPWTNIHIDTRGNYKTCCAGTESLGNLRDDLFNTDLLLDIKSKLVNNQTHQNCRLCANNAVPEQDWYSSIAEQKIIPITQISDQVLQNLDIRWSNTCNLSCVYCDSMFSSVWAKLRNEPEQRTDYGSNLSKIINHITNNKETIKNLGLLGGEPLLQKENEQLLDIVRNDVHINVITNLSVPLAKNKIFNKLLDMKNVMWDISFETVEERFDYVRRGANWQTMLDNIKVLQAAVKERPGHRIGITGQYTIYNCLSLTSLYKYIEDNNLPNIRLNELQYPSEISVFSLPTDLMRVSAVEAIKATEYTKKTFQHDQTELLTQIANRLNTVSNPISNLETIANWHQQQELKFWPESNLRYSKLWPELQPNTP